MRTKKSTLFQEEAKTQNKTDKDVYYVNSPLVSKHFHFANKNYAVKSFLR